MATLGEFLQGGQKRRQWLDQTIGDIVEYYTPPNLRPAVEFVAQMNPIQGMADSMQQGGIALDPSQTPEARKKAALNSIVEGLIAVAPAAVASRGYMTPAQGTMESLLGWSPAGQQIADDLGRFVVDEAGNIPVGRGLPTPRNDAEAMARDILDLRAVGRASEVTDDMMAKADPQYMFNNTPLDMSQEARMARAEDMGFGASGYHGTDRDFVAFDARRFGEKDPGWYGRGVTSDTDPEVAAGYANYDEAEVGQQIMPLRLGGRYIDWPEGQLPFGNKDDAIAGTRDMSALGYSGSKMTNDRDLYGSTPEWGTEYVTFDPRNVRSRFARFDPAFKHLANLSAGVTLASLLGLEPRKDRQPSGSM